MMFVVLCLALVGLTHGVCQYPGACASNLKSGCSYGCDKPANGVGYCFKQCSSTSEDMNDCTSRKEFCYTQNTDGERTKCYSDKQCGVDEDTTCGNEACGNFLFEDERRN